LRNKPASVSEGHSSERSTQGEKGIQGIPGELKLPLPLYLILLGEGFAEELGCPSSLCALTTHFHPYFAG